MKTLSDLLEVPPESAEYQRARALVRGDRELMRALIEIRKAAGLSQDDVAKLLEIKQPSVAAFERYDSDPKLSTIRRYAQAVGALVSHHVVLDCGQIEAGVWPPPCAAGWRSVAARVETSVSTSSRASVQTSPAVPNVADAHRADFAIAA